jgi:excisionase family DNA binding protein
MDDPDIRSTHYTLAEAASYLDVARSWVWALVKSGRLPYVVVGEGKRGSPAYLIPRSAVRSLKRNPLPIGRPRIGDKARRRVERILEEPLRYASEVQAYRKEYGQYPPP